LSGVLGHRVHFRAVPHADMGLPRNPENPGPQVGGGEFDTDPCLCYILTAVGDLVRRLKPLGKGPKMERGDCTAFPAFDGPGEPRVRGGQIIVRNR